METDNFNFPSNLGPIEVFMVEDEKGYHYPMSADIKMTIAPLRCDASIVYKYAPSRWKRIYRYAKFNIFYASIWWLKDLFLKKGQDDCEDDADD